MLNFIISNLATIIISGILLSVVLWIITDMVRKKKSGQSGCSSCGSCGGCPSASICHKE